MVPSMEGVEDYVPLVKDRDIEMQVCKELDVPYFLITADIFNEQDSEMQIMKPKFINLGGRVHIMKQSVESLEGYNLLSRLWPAYVSRALEAITQIGGKNELTFENFQQTGNWPRYVESRFLNRKLGIVTASQLESAVGEYAVNGMVFVKTKTKLLSEKPVIASVDELTNVLENGLPSRRLDIGKKVYKKVEPVTELILSEPISIAKNERGNFCEYRFWVVNDSVIWGYDYEIQEDVMDFAHDFVNTHKGKIPKHLVFDIAKTVDRGNVLIEVNDFMCSGSTNQNLFKKIIEAYVK